ncbi:hypothetical protein [Mycoplasma sp. 3341]
MRVLFLIALIVEINNFTTLIKVSIITLILTVSLIANETVAIHKFRNKM